MKTKQNFKSTSKQHNKQKYDDQIVFSSTYKSFRSKMFEKRALKQIPKIADKQITLHNPLYQQYLNTNFKLNDIGQIPQIWGCITQRRRKAQSVRKNYLKRDIDTPKNLFRSYIKRKSKLIFGIPITRQFSPNKIDNLSSEDKNPQQQVDLSVHEPEVSQFFTQVQNPNPILHQSQQLKQIHTARDKVKRYSEQEHQEVSSSKLFSPKAQATSHYKSRFGQKLMRKQGYLKSQHMQRINNKSVFKMSLQQLRESINWKKRVLNCLNQSISQAKNRY